MTVIADPCGNQFGHYQDKQGASKELFIGEMWLVTRWGYIPPSR